MILREYIVPGPPTTPLVIAPIGDIQWLGRREDLAFDHLVEHIERGAGMGALWLGLGDYIDFTSPSNRGIIRRSELYDNALRAIDDKAVELNSSLYEQVLYRTAGSWLGLVSGHHYHKLQDGSTTDHQLCRLLNAPFLGEDTALVRLTWRVSSNNTEYEAHDQHVDIWLAHGKGAGQQPASPLIVLDRVAQYADADIYIMGHQTKKAYAAANRIVPVFPHGGEPYLIHRALHLVGSGGWSRGYITGQEAGTYVEKGIMRPVTLGAPFIHIRPRWRDSQTAGRKVWDPNITVEA